MDITQLRGMRYPDDYLIRMFFKEELAQTPGRVLELGCGSGNNLLLFAAHGWDITGLDYNPVSIEDARHNLRVGNFEGTLLQHDLTHGLPMLEAPFQALILPSVMYYVSKDATWRCLQQARELLAPGAIVYLRMRLPDDHRFGRGIQECDSMSWRLDCVHTGEQGALNVFWHEDELIALLQDTLRINAATLIRLRVAYENIQRGYLVRNSDIVLWGRTP